MSPPIGNAQTRRIHRDGKWNTGSQEPGGRMRAWRWQWGRYCLMGTEFPLGWWTSSGNSTLGMYLMSLNYTLEVVNMVNLMLYVFYHNQKIFLEVINRWMEVLKWRGILTFSQYTWLCRLDFDFIKYINILYNYKTKWNFKNNPLKWNAYWNKWTQASIWFCRIITQKCTISSDFQWFLV